MLYTAAMLPALSNQITISQNLLFPSKLTGFLLNWPQGLHFLTSVVFYRTCHSSIMAEIMTLKRPYWRVSQQLMGSQGTETQSVYRESPLLLRLWKEKVKVINRGGGRHDWALKFATSNTLWLPWIHCTVASPCWQEKRWQGGENGQ